MKNFRKLTTIMGFVLMSNQAMSTITLNYTGTSDLALGRSLHAELPFEHKDDCLMFETRWSQVNNGAVKMSNRSKKVTEWSEVFDSLKVDVNLAAKAKFGVIGGSANLDLNILKTYKQSSDTLNYLSRSEYDFGEKEIINYKLKPRYAKMLTNGEHKKFIQSCGTHFIVATKQKIIANLLVSISNLSSNENKTISSSLGASISGKIFEGSAKAKFEQVMNMASRLGKVSIQVDSFGGDPSKFNKFSNSPTIELAMEAMSHFLEGVDKESSGPSGFKLKSYESMGLIVPPKEKNLDKFYEKSFLLSLDLEEKIKRLRKSIELYREVEGELYKNLQIAQYKILKQKRRLDEIVRACVNESLCDESLLSFDIISIPWPTSFLEDLEISLQCQSNYLSSVLSGKKVNQDLIQKILITTYLNGSPINEPKLMGRLDFSENPRDGRFLGVIESLEVSSNQELEGLIQGLSYVVELQDKLGNQDSYVLNTSSVIDCN